MSDSEDDYMSDKLFTQCTEDIRPGLVFNRTTKRQYECEKKRKEEQAKRPKNNFEREKELREKGLNTAIPSDNKGFKLLEKMGFKPGEGLGKKKTGLIEPIKVEVKSGKSGLGVETEIKEKVEIMIKQRKKVNLEQTLNEFQNSNKIKLAQKFLNKDFYKAQKACEDLDFRNEVKDPICEYFWTRDTIRKRRKIEEEEEEDFYLEFQEYTTNDNLTEIIEYLRNKYLYCMFCAFVATDADDLSTNCPGPYRSDHDDC